VERDRARGNYDRFRAGWRSGDPEDDRQGDRLLLSTEATTVTESAPTLSQIVARAKTAGALLEFSRQLSRLARQPPDRAQRAALRKRALALCGTSFR
jgi:hypothetical protein